MKQSFIAFLALSLLLPDFAGAGPLSPYSAVIIRDFPADEALIFNVAPDTEEQFARIREKMVAALTDGLVMNLEGSFQKISRSGEEGATPEKSAIVEGSFSAIDAGRRGLRMYIGFSGTASATIQAKVVDGRSGKVLAVFEQVHSAPLGWGGSERVLLRITGELAESLAEFLIKLR